MSSQIRIQSAGNRAVFTLPSAADSFFTPQVVKSLVDNGANVADVFISVEPQGFVRVLDEIGRLPNVEILDLRDKETFYSGSEHLRELAETLIGKVKSDTETRELKQSQVGSANIELTDERINDSLAKGLRNHKESLSLRAGILEIDVGNVVSMRGLESPEPDSEESGFAHNDGASSSANLNHSDEQVDATSVPVEVSGNQPPQDLAQAPNAVEGSSTNTSDGEIPPADGEVAVNPKRAAKKEAKIAYSPTQFIKLHPLLIDGALFQSQTGARLPAFPSIGVQEKANGKKFDDWLVACGDFEGSSTVLNILDKADRSDAIYREIFQTIFGRPEGPSGAHVVKSEKQLAQEETLRLIEESMARQSIEQLRESEQRYVEGRKIGSVIESAIARSNGPSVAFTAEFESSVSAFQEIKEQDALQATEGPAVEALRAQAEQLEMGGLRYYAMIKDNVIVSVGQNDAGIRQSIIDMANGMSAQLLWSNTKFDVDAQYLKPRAPELKVILTDIQCEKLKSLIEKAHDSGSEIKCVTSGKGDIYMRVAADSGTNWISVRQDGAVYRVTNEQKKVELDGLQELLPSFGDPELEPASLTANPSP